MQRSIISFSMSNDSTQLRYSDPSGTTVQPATKRAKLSEDDDTASVSNPDESEATSLLFLQALKPIVESQFLTIKELGRLMVQTSKKFEGEVFDDPTGNRSLWKTLCYMYWGKNDATAILEAVAPMSEKDCFQKLLLDTVRPSLPSSDDPVARLQYSPEDYVVIVSLRDETTDKNIFCKAIKGQDIPNFFKSKCIDYIESVSFDQPIWQTKMPPFRPGKFMSGKPNTEVLLKLDGKLSVHILRRPDQCVVQTTMEPVTESRYNGSLEVAKGEVMVVSYQYGGYLFPTSDYGREFFRNQKPKYYDSQQKCVGLAVELGTEFCKISNEIAGLNYLGLHLKFVSTNKECEEGYSESNFQGGLDKMRFLDAMM